MTENPPANEGDKSEFDKLLKEVKSENGIEASGLSAGTSLALLGNEKLRYPEAKCDKPNAIIESTLYQISYEVCPTQYWLEPESKSHHATFSKIISSMIFTVNVYGLQAIDTAYCIQTKKPLTVNAALTADHKRTIVAAARAYQKHAINLLLAGKVGLYCSNHHLGQGKMNMIMTKLLKAIDDNLASPSEPMKHALHVACHWLDTALAFTILGIKNIKINPIHLSDSKHQKIRADNSLTTRVKTGPAGSARLFMSHAVLVRMMGSPVLRYFKYKEAALKVMRDHATVSKNPVLYHVNPYVSNLATDAAKEAKDNGVVLTDIPIIGMLGSFARVFYKGSTLIKSPIFSGEGGSGDRVNGLEGYSPEWDGICKSIQAAISEQQVKVDAIESIEYTAEELKEFMDAMNAAITEK